MTDRFPLPPGVYSDGPRLALPRVRVARCGGCCGNVLAVAIGICIAAGKDKALMTVLVNPNSDKPAYPTTEVISRFYRDVRQVDVPTVYLMDADITGANCDGCVKTFGFGRTYPGEQVIFSSVFQFQDSDCDILVARCVKNTSHEIGHVLGLGTTRARLSDSTHCADARCVMRYTPDVADLDRISDPFCEHCSAHLRSLLGLVRK